MSDAANSEARLESILDQVRVLKAEHDERVKCTGENFNVFSILDRERKEVTTHSAIIAELLNPQGAHSQGTLFLELFLKQLKPIIDVRNEHTRFKVRTEVFVFVPENEEKGFLDIVIESNNNDAYIVIENKIDTEDAEGQLKKYCEHIETIEKNKKVLLYLTPEGKNPIYLTHYGKGKVALICLSYKEFIAEWLDACIKEVPRIPQIRETLHQYQMTVKKLTGHPINRRYPMALKNILLKNKNYDLIPELETAISEVKGAFQHEFWKKLKERLVEEPLLKEQLADKNPKFQLYESGSGINTTEIPDDKLKKYIGRSFLGLTFSIPDGLLDDKIHEVAFRVDYQKTPNYDYFNYGFVFCKKDTLQRDKIEPQQHEEYLKQYVISKCQDHSNGWISWKYFQYEHTSFIAEIKGALIEDLISEITALLEAGKDNKA